MTPSNELTPEEADVLLEMFLAVLHELSDTDLDEDFHALYPVEEHLDIFTTDDVDSFYNPTNRGDTND